MRAVLLAAGIGKRLRPVTDRIPKPLIEIGGKPIIQWMLEGVREMGIEEVAVITGHLASHIRAYFGDGAGLGMHIRYFSQERQDGTGHAALPAREFLGGEPFFMGYGDIFIAPENYRELKTFFMRRPGESVLGVWDAENPSAGGVIIARNGRLEKIIEKPEPGTLSLRRINAGIMIFQPAILEKMEQIPLSPRGEYELTDAITALASEQPVRLFPVTRYWSDVGVKEKIAATDRWIRENLS